MAKILIVDDTKTVVMFTEMMVKSMGYSSVSALNGKLGLEAVEQEKPDLILLDIIMPVMDGITFIKNLRGEANYKFTPMLMLTTESAADKKAEGKAAGATGWIVKPFNPDQLLNTINKVLG